MSGDGGPFADKRADLEAENPLLALRRQLCLGQADFARALGVSLPALWAAEKGTTANPIALWKALQALGYDTAELSDQYHRWRANLLEAGRLRLRHDLGSDPGQGSPPGR